MFAIITCFGIAYTVLAIWVASIIAARAYRHTDLALPSPTESVEKRTVAVAPADISVPDFNKTIPWLLLRYKLALNAGDRQGAAALLKDMKGIDLGDAALERGDHPTALRLWLVQAQRGDSEAAERIANLYARGATGVAQNEVAALKWYRRCAVRGNPNCQLRMAQFYAEGRFDAKRPELAYMWLSVAMMNAALERNGSDLLLKMFRERERLSRKMSTSEVADAQRLAAHCYSSRYRYCGS
jgi:TPR repeat protein